MIKPSFVTFIAVLSKLLALLWKLWAAIKLASLLPLKAVILLLAVLWKSNLWIPVVFIIVIVPDILGTYSFLTGEGVEWFFAAPTAFGIQFGSALFDTLNGAQHLLRSQYGAISILAGIISSIFSLVWFFYIWHYMNKLMEGKNMSPFWIHALGAMFLSFCIVITLLVDQYVLAEETLRISGLTYFLDDPSTVFDPITEGLVEASEPPEDVNNTDTLNQTVDNNSTRR